MTIMTDREYFNYLEDVFNTAPCNEHLKPEIRVPEQGVGVFTLQIRPDMLHKGGVVHGSTIFKALDDATSVAAMSVTDQMSTLTVSFNISYLKAIVTGTLIATGRVVRKGRRIIFVEGVALDGEGNEIARGSGTVMPVAPLA